MKGKKEMCGVPAGVADGDQPLRGKSDENSAQPDSVFQAGPNM